MLTAQQVAAKEAAHQRFDTPASLRTVEKTEAAVLNADGSIHDEIRQFIPGIQGIGIARDVLRVYVLVDHDPEIEIPDKIEGLRTERVTTTGFRLFAPPRQSLLTPVPCGVSGGHGNITAGTLGCLVDTPAGRCILSNNHVLANTNTATLGDAILQPGPVDSDPANPARRVAGLTDYEPIIPGGAVNYFDAAVAALDGHSSAIPDIMAIGRHANPPVAPFVNQSVAKHGRTTGLTFGTVDDISFDVAVGLNGQFAYFEDQIAIVGDDGPFSAPGDSGSLVLDNPGSHPVGLLFAGDETYTLANPIRRVLNRFGATIVTP